MKQLRLQNESGFTLIELLVVVAIIGILAAIAIPQFSAYRKRGYEAAVKADLRNAATGQEAYFTTAFTYQERGSYQRQPDRIQCESNGSCGIRRRSKHV